MNQPDLSHGIPPEGFDPRQGYPQQQGYAPYPQPYPPPKQGMSGLKIALIIGGVLMAVMVLGGVLVGVLAVATIPKLTEAKAKLELKQAGELEAAFGPRDGFAGPVAGVLTQSGQRVEQR